MKIIRRIILPLVFATLSASASVSAQNVVFKVNAPEEVAAGEMFCVEYVSDTEPADFIEPVFEGVEVLSGPAKSTSRSITVVSGKREDSSKYAYIYVLRCNGDGKFTIPAAGIDVGQNRYETKPVTIKAIPNPDGENHNKAEAGNSDVMAMLFNSDTPATAHGDAFVAHDAPVRPAATPVKKRSAFAYSGFSGGMMIHTGYVSAGNINFQNAGSAGGASGAAFSRKIGGMPLGLGGAVRFHFGKYLRIGGEGYSTSLTYGTHGSSLDIGWGGLLIDGLYRMGRWAPFAGVTLGGGSVNNLTLTNPTDDDFVTESGISYRRYSFMAVTPFVGVEFAATSHMHLVLKADWMNNVSNPQPDFPSGPRIYFGFSFYRVKQAN